MKTIFITAFTNFVARNILATDFLKILRSSSGIRLVIITPENQKKYLQKKLGGENVIFEGVSIPDLSKSQLAIAWLSKAFLHTNTIELFARLRTNFNSTKETLLYYLRRAMSFLLEGFGPGIWIVRKLDYWLLPKKRFSGLFEKYNPSLVFSTDITDRSSGDSDIDLIRETKSRKVPIIGMVRSWDNLTTRGIIREVPDKIVVWNDTIKEECVYYNKISENKIEVVGIPHYDNYLNYRPLSREDFFKQVGLDPKKKTILFVVIADIFLKKQFSSKKADYNARILEILKKLNPDKLQVLVRFALIGEADLSGFNRPSNMVFDEPARLFNKGELDPASDAHLINSIYHSDVVLPGPSTIAVDAMLFGKPVVLVGFDKEKNLPEHQSIKKFFNLEHLQPLTRFGGSRVADSEDNLIKAVEDYLKNPDLDNDARRKTLEKVCYKLDGNSSKRLADLVLDATSS